MISLESVLYPDNIFSETALFPVRICPKNRKLRENIPRSFPVLFYSILQIKVHFRLAFPSEN